MFKEIYYHEKHHTPGETGTGTTLVLKRGSRTMQAQNASLTRIFHGSSSFRFMYVLFLVFHNNAAASSYLASAQSDWALTQRVCQTQWNPHKIFSVWPGVNGNHQKSRMSTTTHSTQQRTSVFFCPLLLLLCCSAAFSVFSGVFANRSVSKHFSVCTWGLSFMSVSTTVSA